MAAEWSYLESVIEAAVWNTAGLYTNEIGAAITTHLTVRTRLDILETLLNLAEDDDVEARLSAFRRIRKTIEELGTRRNQVVHARWVTGGRGSPLIYTVQARGVLKHTVRGMPADEIRAIAAATAEQAKRLKAFLRVDEEDE